MDLMEYRKQIDNIDERFVKLFCERMDIAAKIADYKKENNLPILDTRREREKLEEIADMCSDKTENYARTLYSLLFALSRF